MWPFKKKNSFSSSSSSSADCHSPVKVRILILGTLESGKSTLFKQMRYIGQEPSKDERQLLYLRTVFDNVLIALRHLIEAAQNRFNLQFLPQNADSIQRISAPNVFETFVYPIIRADVEDVQNIWNDPAIQQTFARRYEMNYLPDSAEYFITSIERLSAPNYFPSLLDILHTRVRTTGIDECDVPLSPSDIHIAFARSPPLPPSLSPSDLSFVLGVEVHDVGGARTERRKWIHTMDKLNQIVFLVALSEFDLTLREASRVNRMQESLSLFADISSRPHLSHLPIVLLFTKDDVFREKIQHVSLRTCFREYSGPNEYADARDYVIEKFLSASRQKNRISHVFVGNLIDTPFMEDVVSVIKGNALYSLLTQK